MYSVVITAAGSGSRMKLGYNKLLYLHNKKHVIKYTIEKFLYFEEFSEIIIVCSATEIIKFKKILDIDERIKIIIGGQTRAQSVLNGVKIANSKKVFIHDGARCFISINDLSKILNIIKDGYNYSMYKEVVDTIHYGINEKLTQKLERKNLYAMQTPQIVEKDIIINLYETITDFNTVTDEVGILLDNDYEVKLIKSDYNNEKLTYKEDLRSLDEI